MSIEEMVNLLKHLRPGLSNQVTIIHTSNIFRKGEKPAFKVVGLDKDEFYFLVQDKKQRPQNELMISSMPISHLASYKVHPDHLRRIKIVLKSIAAFDELGREINLKVQNVKLNCIVVEAFSDNEFNFISDRDSYMS